MREQGILPRKHQIVVRSKKGGGGEEEEGDRGEIFFPLGLFSASSAGDDVSLSECQEQSKQSKALKTSIAFSSYSGLFICFATTAAAGLFPFQAAKLQTPRFLISCSLGPKGERKRGVKESREKSFV